MNLSILEELQPIMVEKRRDSKGKVIKKNVGEMDETMLDDWIKQIVH